MRCWVVANIMGECFVSMLRGVIKAFGLQKKIVVFHFVLEGVFQTVLTYLFGFYWEQGLKGIWLVRTITIYLNFAYYLVLLYKLDWF